MALEEGIQRLSNFVVFNTSLVTMQSAREAAEKLTI